MADNAECGPSKRVKLSDENFEETVLKWAAEIGSDVSDLDSDDDFIPSEHDTESEIDGDENESIEKVEILANENDEVENEEKQNFPHSSNYFYGKNRLKNGCKYPLQLSIILRILLICFLLFVHSYLYFDILKEIKQKFHEFFLCAR